MLYYLQNTTNGFIMTKITTSLKTPCKCPACKSNVYISELTCPACKSIVHGKFPFSPLSNLTSEQVGFIKTFILCRGNIKEVEKEMKISYPTVRNKLDEVISTLSNIRTRTTSDVLTALESGEITSADAIELLQQIS